MNIIQSRPENDRNLSRLLLAAAAASLFLHCGLLFLLRDIPIMGTVERSIRESKPSLRLQFVDSPARVETPEKEPEDTRLVSDKASLAQDVIPDRTDRTDSPRSVGEARVKSLRKVPAAGPRPEREEPTGGQNQTLEARDTGRGGDRHSRKIRQQAEKIITGDTGIFNLSGVDRYLSAEADDPEGKTRILKQVAYNTRSPAVAKYFGRIMPRIRILWDFKTYYNTLYISSEYTSVLCKVMPDGRIGELILNDHQGPPIDSLLGLEAVAEAAPFEPLPIDVLEYIRDDGLWLEFNFLY